MGRQSSVIQYRGNLGPDLQGYRTTGDRYTRLRRYNQALNSSNVKTLDSFADFYAARKDIAINGSLVHAALLEVQLADRRLLKPGNYFARIMKEALRYCRTKYEPRGNCYFRTNAADFAALSRIVSNQARIPWDAVARGWYLNMLEDELYVNAEFLRTNTAWAGRGYSGCRVQTNWCKIVTPAFYSEGEPQLFNPCVSHYLDSIGVSEYHGDSVDINFAVQSKWTTLSGFYNSGIYEDDNFAITLCWIIPYRQVGTSKLLDYSQSTYTILSVPTQTPES